MGNIIFFSIARALPFVLIWAATHIRVKKGRLRAPLYLLLLLALSVPTGRALHVDDLLYGIDPVVYKYASAAYLISVLVPFGAGLCLGICTGLTHYFLMRWLGLRRSKKEQAHQLDLNSGRLGNEIQ